jgi:murein L,D-transpeptidase YcbB/YkuD
MVRQTRRGIGPIALLLSALLTSASGASELGEAIEAVLAGPVPEVVRQFRDFALLEGELSDFYDERDYEAAWVEEGRLSPRAVAVLEVLEMAGSHGMRAGDYLAGPIRSGPEVAGDEPTDLDGLARLELALSAQTLRYMKDLHEGRFSPRQLKLGLGIEHRRLDLATELRRVLAAADPAVALERYAPQHEGYSRLREQLAYYRKLARQDDWQALDDSQVIRSGEPYEQADLLRRRLILTGDLSAGESAGGDVYDEALAAAAERFQERHTLAVDGVLGRNTFAQLNRSWDDRADQIAVGLERWRWIPDDRETTLIAVVVPAFRLRAMEDFRDPTAGYFDSKVIVGRSYSRYRTPIFSGVLSYLDFRPYWNIPRSIVRREIAPHLGEPEYLEENDYEIVARFGLDVQPLPVTAENLEKVERGELQLRQRPGPKNALGEVKFIFPNEHNVYLHSTPAKGLFARAKRDFSHGCIRVEEPVGLAEWVLSDQSEWDRAAIERAMHQGGPTRVMIPRRIPVYILYITAIVDLSDGHLHFFDDIYGLDAELASALGYELAELVTGNDGGSGR